MHRPGMISIWFFIGALLLVYGVLICGAGIYEAMTPHDAAAAARSANNLRWEGVDAIHANIWWGGVLILLGAIYTIKFAPRKGN